MNELNNQNNLPDNQDLEISLEKAQKDSQLVQEKQQELELQINQLKQEKDLLNQQKQMYQEQLEQLNQEKQALITRERELLDKEQNLYQNLEIEIEQKRNEFEQQKNKEWQVINQEKNDLERDKTRLNLVREELTKEQNILEEEKQYLQQKINEIKEKETTLKTALENFDHEQFELQREKNNLREEKAYLEQENEKIQEKYRYLRQQEQEINHRKQELEELKLQAQSGFIEQNTSIIKELEKQIDNLHEERNKLYQELARKHQELESEITQKNQDLQQKIEEEYKKLDITRQQLEQEFINKKNQLETEKINNKLELEKEYQQLGEARKELKRQQTQLECDRTILEEDRENLEVKINQKSAQKIELLEAKITYQKEQLEERKRIINLLQTTIINREESDRRFGNRSPHEILTELENLRRIKEELEIELASKPSDIATEKLAQLESEKEQWERDRFRLATELQELKRNNTYSKMAVTEVETLRDEKESLQVNNDRLRNALEELRKQIGQEIEKSKDTSPFPECIAMDENETLQTITPLEESIPNLREFAEDLRYRIAVSSEHEQKRLYYSAQDIRTFLGGLAMSRLHLLEGISGTGKTSLATAFSSAVNDPNNEYKLEPNKRTDYKLIEVQAGWRDRQDLIGYYNAFEKRFYESEFLQALYQAQCPFYRDRIYIIVLDEMNLSRPEQYFADFLSKLEQESPTLTLTTDLNRRYPALFEDHKTLKIPENIWFIGTANQDETTLEFADKTYDRAHIMELGRNQVKFDIPELNYRNPISYQALKLAFQQAQNQYQSQAKQADQFLKDYLADLLEIKFKIGWGNRLERQIEAFIPVVIASGGTIGEATDHLLATKILRKIKNRYDIPAIYLRELREQITVFWGELDYQYDPIKSLNIIDTEINRIEPQI
ncbi:hypothetical protein WEU38_14590 [Cyanobacterium aponinum AL20118]|uniref:ATPase dynein-related AAA domain-containing protein n=1 Tax=Cyanobacterium aponinum AL20115 TaxID=3090662 RepID=A0AAF0ZD15_9CHRO|nr:hypothetical protein [Cyanobacterium aponinum]WPF88025.1 hypothetical protein SAY89_14660 [Cyanobacterium aponinum AL20115]